MNSANSIIQNKIKALNDEERKEEDVYKKSQIGSEVAKLKKELESSFSGFIKSKL